MADDLGAVRRTPRPTPHPRPTGDHQTHETVAQSGAGTTNTPSPVSGDQLAVSSRVTSQGEPAFQAATLAVLEAFNPVGPDDVEPNRSTEFAAYVAEQVERALVGAGWRPPLPDTDGITVHIASEHVRIGERYVRQRCGWCGFLLSHADTDHQAAYLVAPGRLVEFDRGQMTLVPYADGEPLPPGCCALPDDESADDGLCSRCSAPAVDDLNFVDPFCRQHLAEAYTAEADAERQADEDEPAPGPGCYPPADGWDGVSTADEPVDPDDGYPVDLCGKHTGNCSNRCLLPAHHADECDDDPSPDEAQEARAATDWPAEPVDAVEVARRQGVDLYEETAGYHPNTGEPLDPVVRGG